MDLGLTDRVVLVTGAGRDVGRATVLALADEGAQVVAAGRYLTTLQETVDLARGRCSAVALDLDDQGSVDAAVDEVLAHHGRLDALVNTVGPFPRDPTTDVPALGSDASWSLAFDRVFLSAARLTRSAMAPMRAQQAGAVVHVLAASARTTAQPTAQFGAMKAALGHAVKSWAELGATAGIRVNGILPGWIRTERSIARIADRAADDGVDLAEAERRIVAGHPVPFWTDRMGRPEDYADLLTFLVSDRAAYVNGALIPIDGGSPAG